MSDKLTTRVKTIISRPWLKISIAAAVVLVLLIVIAFSLFHPIETKPDQQDHISLLLRSLKKSTKLDVHHTFKYSANFISDDAVITDPKKIEALRDVLDGLNYIQVYYPGKPDFTDGIYVAVYDNETVLCRFLIYGDILEINS